MNFTGEIVLITGASNGIGKELAQQYAKKVPVLLWQISMKKRQNFGK